MLNNKNLDCNVYIYNIYIWVLGYEPTNFAFLNKRYTFMWTKINPQMQYIGFQRMLGFTCVFQCDNFKSKKVCFVSLLMCLGQIFL